MVKSILEKSGFILNETFKETRFLNPPRTTYAVYNDTKNARGADDLNLIMEHEVNIELYEYSPDPEAEARLEEQLDAHKVEWIKQSRYWIQSEQLYQIIYEFNYVEKKGVN